MIDIAAIEKRFGKLQVLKGLNLHVARGKVTAVVGHNGSGKTTLIKILLGLTRPDQGQVVFDGEVMGGDPAYRARIGYMPQEAPFPENLNAREVIAMLKDLRGNPETVDETLIEAFELAPEMDKPLRTLSGGNRQKVSAALAFLFNPDLLILDEPTAGLDPVASGLLKDKIQQERGRGKTVILTSHVMSDIDELADDLALLLDGEVQYRGTVAELKRETSQTKLERAVAQWMKRQATPVERPLNVARFEGRVCLHVNAGPESIKTRRQARDHAHHGQDH